MARTQQQIIEQQIGAMAIQYASVLAQNESLEEQLAAVKATAAASVPVPAENLGVATNVRARPKSP